MTYFADLDTKTQIAAGANVRAVGWLDARHVFPTGELANRILDRLRLFSGGWPASTEALGWPSAAGFHTCDLCGSHRTSGNFGVPGTDVLYVCPEMIAHYAGEHSYLPPGEFIEALIASPLPGTQSYRDVCRRLVECNDAMETR